MSLELKYRLLCSFTNSYFHPAMPITLLVLEKQNTFIVVLILVMVCKMYKHRSGGNYFQLPHTVESLDSENLKFWVKH